MENKKSIARCAGMLSKRFKNYCDEKLEPYGLTNGLYFYLLCVYYQPGATLSQLRKFFQEDKAYTTRSIGRLEEMGLISRERHQNDGRSWCLDLTEEGKRVMEIVCDLPGSWNQELEQKLGKGKVKLLESLLNEALDLFV